MRHAEHIRLETNCDAAADPGEKETVHWMLAGILNEIIDIRFDGGQRAVHRRNCVAPPLRSYSIAPFCAKVLIGIACGSTHVLAFKIAAENENLTLREFRDLIRGNSLVNLLHM